MNIDPRLLPSTNSQPPALAQRWLAPGSHAESASYPDGVHGFGLFPMPLGAAALRRSDSFLADSFPGEPK